MILFNAKLEMILQTECSYLYDMNNMKGDYLASFYLN